VTQKPTAKQQKKTSPEKKKVEREAREKEKHLQRWSAPKARCPSLVAI
jgi:hypothetical protein